MNLADMTLKNYTDLLASHAPTPGGGGGAALTGGQGIALTAMVCALTLDKKKYEAVQELVADSQVKALALKDQFLDAIDRDAKTFSAVSAVYSMAKNTEEEKSARSAALQTALKGCTEPPMDMMEYALESLKLTATLVGKSNVNVASDLGVAALCLKAAVQSAWLNVCINLGSIKDEGYVTEYRTEGEAILAEAIPLADRIYQDVLAGL